MNIVPPVVLLPLLVFPSCLQKLSPSNLGWDLTWEFGLLNVEEGFEKLSLSKQQLIIMITIIEISQFISPHPKYLYNELVNCILSSDGWVGSLCFTTDLGELSCSLMPRICVISYSVICFGFKVVRGNSPAISPKWFCSEQVFQCLNIA